MCVSHPVDWPASRLWAQPRLSWLSFAMAERRAGNLVRGVFALEANVFWSERAKRELPRLPQRAQDLPVPGEDDATARELEDEQPIQARSSWMAWWWLRAAENRMQVCRSMHLMLGGKDLLRDMRIKGTHHGTPWKRSWWSKGKRDAWDQTLMHRGSLGENIPLGRKRLFHPLLHTLMGFDTEMMVCVRRCAYYSLT